MNQLPKEILNYFATFTETRFNFKRLVNYRWTNNEFTLDLPLYPNFQKTLLDLIKEGEISNISISPGQHIVSIKKEDIIQLITNIIHTKYSKDFFDDLLKEERIKANNITECTEEEGQLLIESTSWKEATRSYNLAIRKELESVILSLQEKLLNQFKEENGATSFPSSSFGLNNYLKKCFDILQINAKKKSDSSLYVKNIIKYFEKEIQDIVLYDLFFNLQSYSAFTSTGTLYLFFHAISRNSDSFPLYFIEVDMRFSSTEVTLSFPRNLLLLNIPAINYFKFDRVLTTPRASSLKSANAHLGAIEVFLQTQYGTNQSFILEPQFHEIIHEKNNFPSIAGRIGFQIIKDENKRLLDYSEIMTNLENGGHSQFGAFIDGYISGTVSNHQEEVDHTFQEKYPLTSPKRYMADGPIPLNNSQKRILLALENSKNKMIVVDGPPGTGKSHTIAALTYKANEEGKSVVVTSHKKEALDVIDRMMTDKFKTLHPQAKPSIIRMDLETGSTNNFQNTLTSAVIGAATERSLEYNDKAITEDSIQISNSLEQILDSRIKSATRESENISNQYKFYHLNEELSQDITLIAILDEIPQLENNLNIKILEKFIDLSCSGLFSSTSLDEYGFIVKRKQELPKFIEACEHINTISPETLAMETKLSTLSEDLISLVEELCNIFDKNALLKKLSIKDSSAGFFAKITGKATNKDYLEKIIKKTQLLQFSNSIEEISRVSGKEVKDVTIGDLLIGIERVKAIISLRKYKVWIDEYQKLEGNESMSISEMFTEVQKYQNSLEYFNDEIFSTIKQTLNHYGSILSSLGISKSQLSTFSRLKVGDDNDKAIYQWIVLHIKLSQSILSSGNFMKDVAKYSKLRQKKLEYENDKRLKELNQHLGIMQQLKISFDGGKRFTQEQTKILLNSISVIIAKPSTISRHFPMMEDLIDVLIIDEASQVSIADSISLILRAKQVVIFGDEYQYGAISAINVSTKYSASYFTEIVNAYADDYKISVSESAREEVIREVAKEVKEEDMESDILLRPQDNPGAVLWLKTFNIRTSTLTFAKAIANYTTSLKEHFRSFPEIISYSNDFFYKPAQQELIVNRIRTKPIGETLRFLRVESKGKTAQNTNLDEIDAIIEDIKKQIENGFKGTIGVITSFKEQETRLKEVFNERTNFQQLRRDHKLTIWFVGDVQGEERDIVYYSLVENQSLQNAKLASIYPVIGGTADNIRSLKMQRLNVGFSRAKDTMVFVHSQDIEKFSTTRLGDALKHYRRTLEDALKNDFFIADESIFDSPKEKELYQTLLNTEFVKKNKKNIRIIPQFPIGTYLRAEFAAQIPKYRTDFLLVLSEGGKEQTLILEYDGIEFHFKDASEVSRNPLSREFTDYDNARTLELESYGYQFLRINKFTLRPEKKGDTPVIVLDRLLAKKFTIN